MGRKPKWKRKSLVGKKLPWQKFRNRDIRKKIKTYVSLIPNGSFPPGKVKLNSMETERGVKRVKKKLVGKVGNFHSRLSLNTNYFGSGGKSWGWIAAKNVFSSKSGGLHFLHFLKMIKMKNSSTSIYYTSSIVFLSKKSLVIYKKKLSGEEIHWLEPSDPNYFFIFIVYIIYY